MVPSIIIITFYIFSFVSSLYQCKKRSYFLFCMYWYWIEFLSHSPMNREWEKITHSTAFLFKWELFFCQIVFFFHKFPFPNHRRKKCMPDLTFECLNHFEDYKKSLSPYFSLNQSVIWEKNPNLLNGERYWKVKGVTNPQTQRNIFLNIK